MIVVCRDCGVGAMAFRFGRQSEDDKSAKNPAQGQYDQEQQGMERPYRLGE